MDCTWNAYITKRLTTLPGVLFLCLTLISIRYKMMYGIFITTTNKPRKLISVTNEK